jgi:hypothetical protein
VVDAISSLNSATIALRSARSLLAAKAQSDANNQASNSLAESRKQARGQAKAFAQQRLQALIQQIRLLKLAGMEPKAAAARAAQLLKELAAVVRDYADAARGELPDAMASAVADADAAFKPTEDPNSAEARTDAARLSADENAARASAAGGAATDMQFFLNLARSADKDAKAIVRKGELQALVSRKDEDRRKARDWSEAEAEADQALNAASGVQISDQAAANLYRAAADETRSTLSSGQGLAVSA